MRPDLLGITAPRVYGTGTHSDFDDPATLIYGPQVDGSLDLVAVENLVFLKAWYTAGTIEFPKFQGVAYSTMVDDPAPAIDEAYMFETRSDRHVWIYRENPNGGSQCPTRASTAIITAMAATGSMRTADQGPSRSQARLMLGYLLRF